MGLKHIRTAFHRSFRPFHGLVGDHAGTPLLLQVLLLGLGEAPIGRGVGEDGVRHGVGGVALDAVLDVAHRQLGLHEEVQLAVREAHRHVEHPAEGGRKQSSGWVVLHGADSRVSLLTKSPHSFPNIEGKKHGICDNWS